MLQKLGKEGHKRVAVFPISFVSDHLETLEEIGVQLKEIANTNGINEYYRIPATESIRFYKLFSRIGSQSSIGIFV